MKSIFKYPLTVTSNQTLMMPEGAQILSCQVQRGEVCLWAIVDTEEADEMVYIDIFGTGNPYKCQAGAHVFIDTAQLDGCVWHVFRRVNGWP